jgi:uncharacterized protein YjcR
MGRIHQTPEAVTRLKKQAKFLLLVEGLSQAQTASVIGVTRRTVCGWSKRHKWNKKQMEKSEGLKFEDSLHSFIVFHRIKNPEKFEDLNNLYNEYKASILTKSI